MPASPEDLFNRLEALGIETETHVHPPVFTVEEAQQHCAHLPGAHCKSLFLKNKKGALWLAVTLDERRLDIKLLQSALDAGRLSFGKPELLMEVLGVIPGAVTPFALINDTDQRVTVVLDQEMMAAPVANYHPLHNAATTAIAPADLLRFIADCGHTPIELDFATLERAAE
jgi:Ala-tRNA(Pro) deacylase